MTPNGRSCSLSFLPPPYSKRNEYFKQICAAIDDNVIHTFEFKKQTASLVQCKSNCEIHRNILRSSLKEGRLTTLAIDQIEEIISFTIHVFDGDDFEESIKIRADVKKKKMLIKYVSINKEGNLLKGLAFSDMDHIASGECDDFTCDITIAVNNSFKHDHCLTLNVL